MAKFTFKSLLEDIKNDGYYDNKEAFTSLVIGKFEPWIKDGKPLIWYDNETVRGEQKVIVKAIAPLNNEDISQFGRSLCNFFGNDFMNTHVGSCKPHDVDLVIEPNGPKGLKFTFTFFREIAEIGVQKDAL